jgi:membrane associated rhomboid family serine protease
VIPVGDSPRPRTTAWVTYAIIVANVAVFIYMLTLPTSLEGSRRSQFQEFREQTQTICYGFEAEPNEANRFVCRWGFQPQEWFDNVGGESRAPESRSEVLFSIISSMFLHAGWLHILGNLLFLWVFGDNVEDRLGHIPYLLFYVAAGVVAALLQGLIDTSSVVPVVGASGAIAGVLGAYLVWFPRATVKVLIPFFILIFIPLPVPAVVMIGLWFLQNLLSGLASFTDAATPDSGVAFFAHIGGFLFGMLAVLLFFRGRGERKPPRWLD